MIKLSFVVFRRWDGSSDLRLHYLFALAFAVSFYLVIFGESGLVAAYHLSQEKGKLEDRIQQLRDENIELEKNIVLMQTDRTFQESVIRRKLSYLKKDELIFDFQAINLGSN